METKQRAPRNRTLTLTNQEKDQYSSRLKYLRKPACLDEVLDRTFCQDTLEALDLLPDRFVDLLFADPPYNLTKIYNQQSFNKVTLNAYEA